MSITVKKELNFDDILRETWRCNHTLEKVIENDVVEEFMNLLSVVFFNDSDEIPSMTELNDFIRFEDDFIFDYLGIEAE